MTIRKLFIKQPDGTTKETTWDELSAAAQAKFLNKNPGLGDVVAGAANAVGIKKTAGCGCQKRQDALNQATPNYVRRVLGWLKEAPLPFTASRRA
jgi:pantoate kinase